MQALLMADWQDRLAFDRKHAQAALYEAAFSGDGNELDRCLMAVHRVDEAERLAVRLAEVTGQGATAD